MSSYTKSAHQSATAPVVLSAFFRRLKENWINLFILVLLLHLLFQKDITIRFQLHDRSLISGYIPFFGDPDNRSPGRKGAAMPTTVKKNNKAADKQRDFSVDDFSNLVFILNPAYAEKKRVPISIVKEKIGNCLDYVRQYALEARREMWEHGIPASITLAQGLLESDAGYSRLARESNNHFGIKCRAKCRGCTCRNYSDDDIYDMFRVFEQPLESFKEHSKLLTSKRYRHLLKLDSRNFKSWAHGLKKAGYATDKRYAEKLIRIIEAFELYRYDG